MTKKILFLAYGNPLRRDDAVGLEVLHLLQQRIDYPDCSFMTVIQPFPEMVERIKDIDLLIVLDAGIELKVGEVQCKRLFNDEWTLSHPKLTHFIGPEWLLLLCEQLYEHKPDALLFAIGIEDLSYGKGISDRLNCKLPDIVDRIHSEIQQALEVAAHG